MSAVRRFDRAAESYDAAACYQAGIAERLVRQVAMHSPARILDIGSGTGLVARAARARWPQADLTALDAAPAMLRQARRAVPGLRVINGDASAIDLSPRYDLILSSMMLHWLPDPLAALRRWRGGLVPGGELHVALLTDGSFDEWRRHCAAQGIASGLWPMPCAAFALPLQATTVAHNETLVFPDALGFLRRLKQTGAVTPVAGHKPVPSATLRRVLDTAPRPFAVSYCAGMISLKA